MPAVCEAAPSYSMSHSRANRLAPVTGTAGGALSALNLGRNVETRLPQTSIRRKTKGTVERTFSEEGRMALKSKLLLISHGREESRAHRLAIAIVEYAWDRGAEVRVRRDSGAWAGTWTVFAGDDRAPEVTSEDLEWADVTIVLADGSEVRSFRGIGDHVLATGPRLVS